MTSEFKPQHIIRAGIPLIPLVIILSQYAKARSMSFRKNDWNSITSTFEKYVVDASLLN